MDPLVSILIPCYNAQSTIAQAIESALAQTWPKKEVIVVDDGSTDGSLNIIRQYDGRIRWETGKNRGGGATRNRLLELAKGDWLQYLDADDILLPEKIERQVEFARVHPDSDVIYSPVAWERLENGQLIRTETPIPEPRDPWILLAGWLLPQTGGPLWRKSKLLTIDGWKVGQPCCQEHELYGRLLEAGARFQYCQGCYAVYRDLEQDARVTRKSKGEFVRQKLAILDRLEDALRKSSQITPARRQAVNDARHQMARNLWSVNRHDAKITYRRILLSDPLFQPSLGASSPLVYLLIYKLLGFQGAEVLASLRRALNPWRVAGSYRKRCSI